MSILENLPSEDYFKLEAASNSALKIIHERSPAHFKYREPEDFDTRAKEIGRALHSAILEPDLFASHYLIANADVRTAAEYRGLAKDVGGDRVLTKPEHKRIIGMQNAAYANTRFKNYMGRYGRNELSVLTKDPITGAPVKCRFDRKGDSPWALDVKKCQDALGDEFTKSISNYGYYMQIAFYADVWEWETGEKMDCVNDFPIVAIEEKSPHGVILHDLDDVALILGRRHYRQALNTYADCMSSGIWPCYPHESETTSVTSWMANELDEAEY